MMNAQRVNASTVNVNSGNRVYSLHYDGKGYVRNVTLYRNGRLFGKMPILPFLRVYGPSNARPNAINILELASECKANGKGYGAFA